MKSDASKTYHSNGSLIITGEYFVLVGARALAVPLKYGQLMRVKVTGIQNQKIDWKTYESGNLWFRAEYDTDWMIIISSDDREKAIRLQTLLKHIRNKKPGLFGDSRSYEIVCDISFNSTWGWGTSSTLICNLADWSGLDAFELSRLVSNGSGYDIAASGSETPIYFTIENENRTISPAPFNPAFKDCIFFLYSGKKQNSEESISENMELIRNNRRLVPEISWLTERIATETDAGEFMRYLSEHENIISKTLKLEKIREMYFKDFEGEIKSLGAWGGDFLMVASRKEESEIRKYFSSRGLNTLFRFEEIIRD